MQWEGDQVGCVQDEWWWESEHRFQKVQPLTLRSTNNQITVIMGQQRIRNSTFSPGIVNRKSFLPRTEETICRQENQVVEAGLPPSLSPPPAWPLNPPWVLVLNSLHGPTSCNSQNLSIGHHLCSFLLSIRFLAEGALA